MRKIVSVHSHHDGPGKTHLTANLAAAVARLGKRVGLLAADPEGPTIHTLFGLDPKLITHTVADYLEGRCAIPEAAYRVTPREVSAAGGSVYLIPAGPHNDGHSAEKLSAGFEQALAALHLDYLFLDAPAGAGERALLSLVAADCLVLALRPDRQDYLGTAIAAEVARKLGVPNLVLVLNDAPASLDPGALRADLERAFGAGVGAVLPPVPVTGLPAGAPVRPGGCGTGRGPRARGLTGVAVRIPRAPRIPPSGHCGRKNPPLLSAKTAAKNFSDRLAHPHTWETRP